MIAFTLIEQHPGFGEWGQAWASQRGFTDHTTQISRGDRVIDVGDDVRLVAGDHWVEQESADQRASFIVSYVEWTADECLVYARFNGYRKSQ